MRRYWIDIALLVALLAATPLWLGLGYRGHRVTTLPADALPVLLPSRGLQEAEPLADRPELFRWTDGAARLEPPNPGGPLYLRLTLASGFDHGTPLQLRAANVQADLIVNPGLRSYALLLPPQPAERLRLELHSPSVTIDGRQLGVVFQRLLIAGNGPAPVLSLAALLLATLGAYGLVRRAGLSSGAAATLVLALQALAALWELAGVWRYALAAPLLAACGVAALAALLIERLWPPVLGSQTARRARAERADPADRLYGRRDWLALGGLLLLALAVCVPWLGAPDPVGDLELSARRMGFMARGGFVEAFTYGGDYMPLRLYILRLLAPLVPLLGGAYYDPLPAITRALIKLPSLVALLLSVALIFTWARRYVGLGRAALLAGLYAVAPPVWMNVAWWGQVDVLLALPMLASVVLLDRAGGRWSWLCWAIALMIKPQAIVLAPLLYMATLRLHGPRGLAQGGGLALSLIALACAPFALIGQGPGLYQAAVGSVGRFPQVTNRAYNLWWLVVEDRAVSDLTTIGLLSYRSIGFLLMGLVVLLLALSVLNRPSLPRLAVATATLSLAFFTLPTQIHERYIFFALPFLLLGAAVDLRLLVPFGVLSVVATINIVGAIGGFFPSAYRFIRASPLPLAVAWVCLALLLGLLVYLWAPDRRDGESASSDLRPGL